MTGVQTCALPIWPTEEDVDVFAATQILNVSTTSSASSNRVSGPVIRKLSCQYDSNDISGASYFIPLYLFKLGIARNLTHLAFYSTCAVEWEAFLSCISAACSTLTCLHIEVAMFTVHGKYPTRLGFIFVSNYSGTNIIYINATHRNRSRRRDRKSTRLNSSHSGESRMPSSA